MSWQVLAPALPCEARSSSGRPGGLGARLSLWCLHVCSSVSVPEHLLCAARAQPGTQQGQDTVSWSSLARGRVVPAGRRDESQEAQPAGQLAGEESCFQADPRESGFAEAQLRASPRHGSHGPAFRGSQSDPAQLRARDLSWSSCRRRGPGLPQAAKGDWVLRGLAAEGSGTPAVVKHSSPGTSCHWKS